MKKMRFVAACTFGLEACVKRECIDLGFEDIRVSDGSVFFSGDFKTLAKANIWLRCADRVSIILAEFKALEFEDIFQNVKELNWCSMLPENANFIITGKSVRSKLSSVPACQSVTEKAIIEKLRTKYNYDRFPKTGAEYKIQIGILNDVATISLDTTGASLHKRGYRIKHNIAPIKETMAAALISLSFWRRDRVFLDPFCGSGTFAIEAALMAKNIAPGINRKFSAEKWGFIPSEVWKEERKLAYTKIDNDFCPKIYASDIDEEAIKIAIENAENAGVDDCIEFSVTDFENVKLPEKYGVCVCNPPYAQRLGEKIEVEKLYSKMGKKFRNEIGWSVYAVTSCETFEKCYGRKADKKRKLFNGNLKVDYYQYFGKKPE